MMTEAERESYRKEPPARGSAYWHNLKSYADSVFQHMGIEGPPGPTMPEEWRATVQGEKYPEMWLRYYAIQRHFIQCMACCSDFTNRMVGIRLPIVQDRKLDLELMLAHAKLIQQDKQKLKPNRRKIG